MVLCALLVSLAVAIALPAGGDGTHEKPAPTLPGKCPDFTPAATVDSTKLNGDWFGVYALKKGFELPSGKPSKKCIKETITSQADGSFSAVLSAVKDGQPKSKTFTATPVGGKNTVLSVKKGSSDDAEDKTSNHVLTIVAFDDTSYLVTVFCGDDGTNHGYGAFVLSRAKTLADADLQKVKDALKAVGITDELKAVDQTGC